MNVVGENERALAEPAPKFLKELQPKLTLLTGEKFYAACPVRHIDPCVAVDLNDDSLPSVTRDSARLRGRDIAANHAVFRFCYAFG